MSGESYNVTLSAQSGLASWSTPWIPVGVGGWRDLSVTLAWSAVASTSGTLSVEGTDDPTGTIAVPLTVDVAHGAWPTVGATADKSLVVLSDCPGYVRVVYTRSAGGGAGQFTGAYTAV